MAAAARRGRKATYRGRKMRQRQTRPPKIQTRRKKLYSRQRKKTKTQRAVRFARSRYQTRRNTATRYFDRRLRNTYKTRYPARSYSRKVYRRKPQRVGRPRKGKQRTGGSSRYLHTTLKRTARKKQVNGPGLAVPRTSQRKTRKNKDEIANGNFYKSKLEGTAEANQSDQPSQQLVVPKKRTRHLGTPVQKSQ